MTLATFTPPRAPSPGTSYKAKPKILKADFGDGYSQSAADGTNWIKSTVSLTWEALTPTEEQSIVTFLRTQGGYIPFWYQLSDAPASQRWLCEEWQVERGQGGLRKVSATFTEFFGVLV